MERMTSLDASMLYTETATAHLHTMRVAVFDGTAETWLLNDSRRIVGPISGAYMATPVLIQGVVSTAALVHQTACVGMARLTQSCIPPR